MTKTVECASELGFARDETVSAMGSSPFTKLGFALAPKSLGYFTIDAYEQLPSLRTHINQNLGKGSCFLYFSDPAYNVNTGDRL